jgi:hypothetical protein
MQGSWPIGSASISACARCDDTVFVTTGQARNNNHVRVDCNNANSVELITCIAGVDTTRATYGYTLAAGDTIELRCGTMTSVRQFQVLINGSIVISWTDTGAVTGLGAAYRSAAIRPAAGAGVFAQAPPMNIATFAMADTPAAAGLTGVGWRLYRANTASVNVTTGTAFPASFFDTAELGTAVTASLSTGTVTVPKSGWYMIKAGITVGSLNPATNSINRWQISCAVGGAQVQKGPTHRWVQTSNATAFNDQTADATFIVYAQAGQTIACFLDVASANFPAVGSPGGDKSYFSGALMSPPGS